MADTVTQNQAIEAFIALLANQPQIVEVMARELWDADDIACYLKCARNTVVNKYTATPTFPRAVGGGDMRKMWKQEEVRAWAMRVVPIKTKKYGNLIEPQSKSTKRVIYAEA